MTLDQVRAYFARKRRLWIEYTLLAVTLAVAGVAVSLWVSKAHFKIALGATQTQLVAVWGRMVAFENTANSQARQIEALQAQRTEDANAVATLRKSDAAVQKRLNTLEIRNEADRAYLQQPVPKHLRGLLHRAKPAK